MSTRILLVDLTAIPCSFESTALFVNDTHILEADESNDHPVEEVAESLGKALNVEVTELKLTPEQLAEASAKNQDKLDEFRDEVAQGDVDYDEWLQGYDPNDVLTAVADR